LSESTTVSRFHDIQRIAQAAGLDAYQEPVPSWYTYNSHRLAQATSGKRQDGWSKSTQQKYLSALCTTILIDPVSSAKLTDHPLIKELQQVLSSSLPGRNTFDMEHTLDIQFVLQYTDRFSIDEGAPILSNETLTPFQLQLRLAVLLTVIDSRRPADLEHIVGDLCSTSPGIVNLHFSRLKKQETGNHLIRYHLEAGLPPHRDLRCVLEQHLSNRQKIATSASLPVAPNLFLCKVSDSTGSLSRRPAISNTIASWLYKHVLVPSGYPEFNAYALVKAAASVEYTRDRNEATPSLTRWKSRFVAYRHYIKQGARVWPPAHKRADRDELKSESSNTHTKIYSSHSCRLWEIA
jgi:hypothetical protein